MHNTVTVRSSISLRATLFAVAAALSSLGVAASDAVWVSTSTKAFSPGKTVMTLAMQPEAAAGTPVSISVGLKLRNSAELDHYLATLGRPGTRTLSHQEVLDRFAPTRAQAEAVAAHLRQAGFTRVTIAPNRLLVQAQGSAASVKTAFHTTLKTTRVNGKVALFNSGDALVPASLSSSVMGVLGLQTVHTLRTHHQVLGSLHALTAQVHRLDQVAGGEPAGRSPPSGD